VIPLSPLKGICFGLVMRVLSSVILCLRMWLFSYDFIFLNARLDADRTLCVKLSTKAHRRNHKV
jgi:hypothetical protein